MAVPSMISKADKIVKIFVNKYTVKFHDQKLIFMVKSHNLSCSKHFHDQTYNFMVIS